VTDVVAAAGAGNRRLSNLADEPNPVFARHVAWGGSGGSGGSKMYYYHIIEFPIDIIIDFTATSATTSKTAEFSVIVPAPIV
jgi:hypothetical protein